MKQLSYPECYTDFLETTKRYAVLKGGAGSGKTYIAASKVALRCLMEEDKRRPHTFLVLRKVAETIRVSTYQQMLDVLKGMPGVSELLEAGHITSTVSPFQIKFWNGNRILFMGLDDPEKLKSITGITGTWLEEATEFEKQDFDQIDLRVRGHTPYYKQHILTFNPVSTFNWVYPTFFGNPSQERQDNMFVQSTTYLDNPFIDVEYKAALDSLKSDNPEYYEIYALGNWGTLSDTVYRMWESRAIGTLKVDDRFWGVDVGLRNPSALVRVEEHDGLFFITEEVYGGMESDLFLNRIAEKVKNLKDEIYVDPAAADLIERGRKIHGLNMIAADNSVAAGINYLKTRRIFTLPTNVNLNKELTQYCWKKRNGEPIDEVVKLYDHALDASRYAIYGRYKRHEAARLGTSGGRVMVTAPRRTTFGKDLTNQYGRRR